jgi:hypothetical protein
LRRHPLGVLQATSAATRFRADRSRGSQRTFRSSALAAGVSTEVPIRSAGPLDRRRVPTRRPSLCVDHIGRASRPPPKRRLQTPPRTRLVNQFPSSPGPAVSSEPVVRIVDHVRRRPARSLSGSRHRLLRDKREGKRSMTVWEPNSGAGFRDTRRLFASPREGGSDTCSTTRNCMENARERKNPEKVSAEASTLSGFTCRSHSCPKAGLFPATKEPSRTLCAAVGSPPLQ